MCLSETVPRPREWKQQWQEDSRSGDWSSNTAADWSSNSWAWKKKNDSERFHPTGGGRFLGKALTTFFFSSKCCGVYRSVLFEVLGLVPFVGRPGGVFVAKCLFHVIWLGGSWGAAWEVDSEL